MTVLDPAGDVVAYDPEVATFRTYCGHCDAPVNADAVWGPDLSGNHPQHTRWGVCPVCTNGILQLATGEIYPEPVKAFETNAQDFFCASLSIVGWLIHAAVGSLGGFGRRLPNRVGLAA